MSFVIKKMSIKSTKRYYLTLTRMTEIKETGEDVQLEFSYIAGRDVK